MAIRAHPLNISSVAFSQNYYKIAYITFNTTIFQYLMINLLKFIHVICALSLFGGTVFGLISAGKNKISSFIHRRILYVILIVVLTGTLLVHPKYFTFHAPWIQAAYILVIAYMSLILLMNHFRDSALFKNKGVLCFIYSLLIIVLLLVIHDAVTKKTFFDSAAHYTPREG